MLENIPEHIENLIRKEKLSTMLSWKYIPKETIEGGVSPFRFQPIISLKTFLGMMHLLILFLK